MIGTTVAGRYQIEEQIGIGGMGIVYRAHDSRLRRDVALKMIAPHLMQQEAARSRFLREAQALAGLTHVNIVTIFDMAEDEDAHTVFLVMELLSGHSLRYSLEEGNGSPASDRPPFSHIALPLCRALEAAHGHGVLHRDIKPENIFVCADGSLKLMDFGLARLLGDMSKNQSSTVAGTLAYMAPEQLRGETLDARADLYALGIVFYEYLAGQLPFQADNPGALLLKHLTEPPPHLRGLLPDLPMDMDALLMRMLAKEPNARFSTAGEIRELLERPLPDGSALISAVDQVVAGKGIVGNGTKTRQYPLSATLSVMPSLMPTQSPVQAPTKIQNPKSRRADSRPVAAALAGVGVLAALMAGKTLLGKAEANSSARPFAHSASVLPVSQKAPFAAAKITPPAPAASVPHSEASSETGTGSLAAQAEPAVSQSPVSSPPVSPPAVSGSLPTPNKDAAPNNPLPTPALTKQQMAELETLRREQQEELALLRSLRKQIAEKSENSVPPQVSADAALAKRSAMSGKAVPSATNKTVPASSPAPSEAASGHAVSAPSNSLSGGQPTIAAPLSSGTSQYEERLPLPALRIRAWRLPAPDDSKSLHIGLRNSVDCNAYFYIIEDDTRRAVRAYPGPERFLAPQSQTPTDVRLPFSSETGQDHQKAVLMIAAPREITGLPPTLALPPTPADKPPAGATPQQQRAFFGQAMRRFDAEIVQQLQQNHARLAGQALHPHDLLVRVVGFSTGLNGGPRNRRADRISGNSPEHTIHP